MSMYDGLGLDQEQIRRMNYLIPVASTVDIQKQIDRDQKRLASTPDWDDQSRRTILSQITYQEKSLALAFERDAIQASRPDGCWCLGVGGKDPGHEKVGEQAWSYLTRHCQCPEGQARRAIDLASNLAYRAARCLERSELFRESLPSRFQDFTIESWKATTPEQIAVQEQLRAWFEDESYDNADGEEVDMPRSLVLHGPYGTGKTGLAGAIGAQLLANGEVRKVQLAAVPRLLDRVRGTFNRHDRSDETEADVMEELFDVECLILDDVGAERATDWATEKLFTLINHRHDEELRTIITSNLDPEGLAEHLGERTWWRIHEMSYVVDLTGCPNLRVSKPKRAASPAAAASEPSRKNVVQMKRRSA